MLTKEESLEIKGVAILLMIMFHLFGFPERTPEIYADWIGTPITKAFQICVPLFLFLGGYGLECLAAKNLLQRKQVCGRIKKLYVGYWWICVPTIIVGMLIGYYHIDVAGFSMEMVGITSSYVGEWWFFSNYLELFLLFSCFQKVLNSAKFTLTRAVSILSVLLVCCRIIGACVDWGEYGLLGRHVQMLLVNMIIFLLGCVFARFGLFDALKRKTGRVLYSPLSSIFLITIPILVRAYLPFIGITELVVVPMFCLGVVNGRAWMGGAEPCWLC